MQLCMCQHASTLPPTPQELVLTDIEMGVVSTLITGCDTSGDGQYNSAKLKRLAPKV